MARFFSETAFKGRGFGKSSNAWKKKGGSRRSGKWREFFFLSSNSVLISHVNYTKNGRCFFHFEQNSFPKTKKPIFFFRWMNFISHTKFFVWNSFLENAGNCVVCVCVVLRASPLGSRLFDPSPVWPPHLFPLPSLCDGAPSPSLGKIWEEIYSKEGGRGKGEGRGGSVSKGGGGARAKETLISTQKILKTYQH